MALHTTHFSFRTFMGHNAIFLWTRHQLPYILVFFMVIFFWHFQFDMIIVTLVGGHLSNRSLPFHTRDPMFSRFDSEPFFLTLPYPPLSVNRLLWHHCLPFFPTISDFSFFFLEISDLSVCVWGSSCLPTLTSVIPAPCRFLLLPNCPLILLPCHLFLPSICTIA